VKYVRLDPLIDPTAYLERLPALVEGLPAGARAFATDPGHYDFGDKRCVKDLKLRGLLFNDRDEPSIDLDLQHNCWKHEDDLTIHYAGVTGFAINIGSAESWRQWQGGVILDEILPAPEGCVHEIAFLNGSLTITSLDLTATWFEAECPEKT
jgi:hypothetical protein